MDNENLQEIDTNKSLALKNLPLKDYLVIRFNENFNKSKFIEFAKKINKNSDLKENTQFCNPLFEEIKQDGE